jgi:glutaredoxin
MTQARPSIPMKPPSAGLRASPRALPRLLGVWAAATLSLAPAWGQYKVVAPDGSVTYTDRPSANPNARISSLGRNGSVQTVDTGLPVELRQVAQRYPVVLYTSSECAPCDAGRKLLQLRGVPYTEKRVASEDDAAVLDKAIGARAVPALLIGTQPLRGYSEGDWTAYLDAAGYPRESKLPRGWQQAAAQPANDKPAASRPAASAPPARVESPPPEAKPTTGLRF